MRMFVKAEFPVEASNAGVRSGALQEVVDAFAAAAKPEAMYFLATSGKRTMIAVFDMASSSDVPRLFEPFFLKLNASIELEPCMNADDLRAGLQAADLG